MTPRPHTPTPIPGAVMDRAVATRLASLLLAVVRKDVGDGSGMTVPPAPTLAVPPGWGCHWGLPPIPSHLQPHQRVRPP